MRNRHNQTIKHAGFLKAVEQNYANAQSNLDLIYHHGYGTPQDFVLRHDCTVRIHYQCDK